MGSRTPLADRSILVVEDEPAIALGIKELLEAEGASVHLAPTPSAALKIADEVVLSAAILDFGSDCDPMRPLCRTLHAYGIPFMYYTGHDDIGESATGVPVLTKPATGPQLMSTLARLIRA
jgi:CheY-like chemotaxis protein